jgi:hypothetical protein
MRTKTLVTFVATLSAAVASAAVWLGAAAVEPVVSRVLNNGATFEVSGGGFGSRSRQAPIKWETFDAGTSGAVLSGWTITTSHGVRPVYSTLRTRKAGLSARFAFVAPQYNCTAYITGLTEREIFLSYWVYVERLWGDPSRNLKLARVATTLDGDAMHGTPSLGFTGFSELKEIWYTFAGGTSRSTDEEWDSKMTYGSWHRVESWARLSTPDVADGSRRFWLDRARVTPNMDEDHVVTLSSAAVNTHYENVLLGMYVAHDPGGDYAIYYDDVYVDNTRARVEVCNASRWSEGGLSGTAQHCEVQPSRLWSDDRIVTDVNVSTFSAGELLYLYVVDANGAVNAKGYQLAGPHAPTGVAILR